MNTNKWELHNGTNTIEKFILLSPDCCDYMGSIHPQILTRSYLSFLFPLSRYQSSTQFTTWCLSLTYKNLPKKASDTFTLLELYEHS